MADDDWLDEVDDDVFEKLDTLVAAHQQAKVQVIYFSSFSAKPVPELTCTNRIHNPGPNRHREQPGQPCCGTATLGAFGGQPRSCRCSPRPPAAIGQPGQAQHMDSWPGAWTDGAEWHAAAGRLGQHAAASRSRLWCDRWPTACSPWLDTG